MPSSLSKKWSPHVGPINPSELGSKSIPILQMEQALEKESHWAQFPTARNNVFLLFLHWLVSSVSIKLRNCYIVKIIQQAKTMK